MRLTNKRLAFFIGKKIGAPLRMILRPKATL